MSFLQPIALAGIILAATPIVIHLLNLMRHRRESWAAMRFLLKAKKSSSRMSKIRRWLTLLLRMLSICSLVILFARPISVGNQSFIDLATKEPELVLLILDRSSSMQRKSSDSSKTLLQKGLEEFSLLSKSWPNSKIAVMETLFAEPIFLDKIETIYSKEMQDFIGPTDSGANLPETINRSLAWLNDAEIGQAEILVISDQQEASWQINENSEILKSINETINNKQGLWKLVFLDLKPTKAINYSIHCKSYLEEAGTANPTLLIKGNQRGQERLAVKIRINGDLLLMDCEFTYPSTTWTPSIPLTGHPPVGWISITLPEDSFSGDNEYYFTYGNQSMLKVGISTKDSETERFVVAASSLDPDRTLLSKNLFSKQQDPSEHDLLIIQGDLTKEDLGFLDQFLLKGGMVVLFPSANTNDKNIKLQTWSPNETKSQDGFFTLSEWNKNEGVFANTTNGKELPLSYLKILQRVIPQLGQPLAFYADGQSFLTRKIYGQGVLYSFSTLPNLDWSSLGEGFVFVPVIQRIIDECRQKSDFEFIECGDNNSLNLNRALSITGEKQEKPSAQAGIYKDLGNLLAVNRPAGETVDNLVDKNELQDIVSTEHASWNDAQTATSIFKRAEIWNFFLILMIIFLLLEGALSIPQLTKSLENSKV